MIQPSDSPSSHHPGPTRRELARVLAATSLASLLAILWSWRHHAFLLYGDAEAHIHIARRLFDSHRPGITQLGSVWLPLSHLILVPFVAVDPWWRSGFAPVIPSAACYLLASLGLYRLARKWVSPPAAWIGLALFAANPNLLYLQTTAMTEPLFLCELIWSVLLLVEWYQSLNASSLNASGLENRPAKTSRLQWTVIAVLIAAIYTRYDGWILAFLAWIAMAICLYRRGRLFRPNGIADKDFLLATILLALAPTSWFLYNAITFGDWLEFQRGPYSAKMIELRTSSSATNPHPGWHNPWVALVYFLKAAEMDIAALGWGETIALAAVLSVTKLLFSRPANNQDDPSSSRTLRPEWASQTPSGPPETKPANNQDAPSASRSLRPGWASPTSTGPAGKTELQTQPIEKQSDGFITHRSNPAFLWTLLLWLPVPFYAYSVSYGSVPIFLPVWQPFSYYNTRYGMELLPALAFFFCFAVQNILSRLEVDGHIWKREALVLLTVLLAANFKLMLHQKPIVYEEAVRNSQSRSYYNAVIARTLAKLHTADPNAIFLMDTSNYPSIVPHAGLTYRETINESDKQFYQAALGSPAAHASVIVTFGDGDIAKAVKAHPEHLRLYQSFHPLSKAWDQADVTIYVSDTFPNSPSSSLPPSR